MDDGLASSMRVLLLTERTRFGDETGAGLMRNRCAFTSRDMGADWPEAFVYAVVLGWDNDDPDPHPDDPDPHPDDPDPHPDDPDPHPDDQGAMDSMADRYGWDEDLIAFLRDAHRRFKALADKSTAEPTNPDPQPTTEDA